MKAGIGYLPEDRKGDGIIQDLSVRENIILALQVLNGFSKPLSRAESEKLADEYINLIIPRGSNNLVKYIKSNTKIPVLGHASGICHIFVDKNADIDDAIKTAKIVLNKFNCDFALIFDNVSEKNASKELRETQDNAIRVNKVE